MHTLSLPCKLLYASYRYTKLRFLEDRSPFGCSLSPTIKCNLKCPYCYEQYNRNRFSNKDELSMDEMRILVDKLYKEGIRHATLTDGEPLLSKQSIEKCEIIINKFWITYVVTNGTKELPDFPVTYVVSLDGTPRIHDKLRGKGVFAKIKNNMKKSPRDNIYALSTLNSYNHNYIPQITNAALELGFKGIMFNWHNPLSYDDPFWVDYSTRNKDIDTISNLIEQRPDFIYNTMYELNYLRSPTWTKFCPHWWIVSINAFGEIKKPCIFGSRAICERCGCHVFPALLEIIRKGKRTVEYRLMMDYAKSFWFGNTHS